MHNARARPEQSWKSCANGSNIVALPFGDHRTKEMVAFNRNSALTFVQDLYKNLRDNEQTDVIVMDFAKAFDKVGTP